jgi:hypothetical protein
MLRSLRNVIIFLIALTFNQIVSAQNVTILSEDFASLTTGSNTSTTGSTTQITSNLTTNFSGTSSQAYSASGMVKIGSGSNTGYITSKTLDLSVNSGSFSVSFDVKGWTTVEGSIIVTVTGITAQTVTYTATMSSTTLENKVLNFTGGTASSTVRISTTARRAFIDNVSVYYTGTLPIKLEEFVGFNTINGHCLKWLLNTDSDNVIVDVERSSNSSQFETIYSTATSQNFNNKYATYTDTKPLVNNNYYRLKMTDIDGKITYSNVVSILSTIPNTAVKILSNPIQNGLLQVQVGQVQSIVLQNAVGQIMVQKTLSQGLNNINVGNLPKGIYFVKVGNTVKKIVLQ